MTETYTKENPQTIRSMFNDIANRYDLTNSVLSFNMHKRWNQTLIQKVLDITQSHAYADLCTGTGDIGLPYLQHCQKSCESYLIDFSPKMLDVARQKSSKYGLKHHKIQFVEADVQILPLADCSIDRATMAYGIRNVKSPQNCINEIFRILKPGGVFGILELTQPKNRFLQNGHRLYLKAFLPLLGKLLTSNEDAYKYLKNSIHSFIKIDELKALLTLAGFSTVNVFSLSGGIATLLIAKKSQ